VLGPQRLRGGRGRAPGAVELQQLVDQRCLMLSATGEGGADAVRIPPDELEVEQP
jgi:hypothetical protein